MKELITELRTQNIHLSVENDELVIGFDGDGLPDELISKIRNNKSSLIKYFEKYNKTADYMDIPLVSSQESYPISSGQFRLWMLSQFEGGLSAYNARAIIQLEKHIDIGNFRRAIHSTIDRHESLRTIFKMNESGEVRQWILPVAELNFNCDYKDFRAEENKEAAVESYIKEEESGNCFDLQKGPLLRAGLFQLEEDRYIFYYNMHHIICDGKSMEIFSKDLLSYYEAYKEDKEPQFEKLRIQYKDYSAWQLAELRNPTTVAHKNYWMENLSGKLPVLELPFMNKRPAFKSFKGGIWSAYIDHDLSSLLRENCKKNKGTLFHGMLASWLVLIHKYSNNTDLIIGTSVSGRNHLDLQDQIGYYSNSIALRNNIEPGNSFTEIVKTVIENTNNSMMHQDYPFNQLVTDLELKREANRNPVFDTMLVFHNAGELTALANHNNREFTEITHAESGAKFDLEVSIDDLGSVILFSIIYDSDIFQSLKVKNMIMDYKFLLNELLNNLDTEIRNIRINDQARQEIKKMNLSKLTSKK